MRVVRVGRRLPLRYFGLPAALVGAILLFIVSGSHGTAPATATADAWRRAATPQGLPISTVSLRYLLGEGLPTIGLAEPSGGPLSASTSLKLVAFLSYTLTGVAPHVPQTVLQSAFSGFGFTRGRSGAVHSGSLGDWLTQVDAGQHAGGTPGAAPTTPPNDILYGRGMPLIAVYATEGEGEYAGRQPAASAPPPTTANRSRNVLGIAQQLAQALGDAGIPTLFANRVNDGEGELGAYLNSAAIVGQVTRQYPGLELIIDVERPLRPSGPAAVRLAGQRIATMTLLVGTGARLPDDTWRQNLALAKALGAFLARSAPGAFLGIQESPDRLNQELSPAALTLDIGGSAATPKEARAAIPLAVQAIVAYLSGQSASAAP